MKYENTEMKVEEMVSSFNAGKINLIPPFQRGSVWSLNMRRRLIVNMIKQRPIPAIFLYREPAGSKFSYNILDGKQRLETLILFIGDKRSDIRINKVADYFFKKTARDEQGFSVSIESGSTKMVTFANLKDELVRDFREFKIATIEIDLDSEDDPVSMDEIINLFIDINTYGKKVKRFDIVKTMAQDPLLKQALQLIARREVRKGKSVYFKAIDSDAVYVLKRLNVVTKASDPNAKVDRMWERLTEIVLFSQKPKHRAPTEILKGFINARSTGGRLEKLTKEQLRRCEMSSCTCAKRTLQE